MRGHGKMSEETKEASKKEGAKEDAKEIDIANAKDEKSEDESTEEVVLKETEGKGEAEDPSSSEGEGKPEAGTKAKAEASKEEAPEEGIKIIKEGEGENGEGGVVMIDGTTFKTEELTEPDIRSLEKRRDRLNSKAEEHKHKRDRLNDRTRELIRSREKLNNRIRKLVKEANECKEERNNLNQQVKEAKGEREILNKTANELNEKVNKLKKERLPQDEGPSIGKLRRELRELEFKQQTSTLSTSAERDLVDRMKKLSEQIKERERKLEQNEDVRQAVREARKSRQSAEAQHKLVGELADRAQTRHDRMVELYSQSDELRKDLHKIHENLVDTKKKADEEHRMHIALIRQVHDYDKLIFGMKRKMRRAKKARGETDVKKHQREIMDKFKKGEKLSTEDLLALQNK
jgi:uncharacterized coiled-coil DUF342 family protein